MNVFVIGATGYIGRRVTTKLLAAEHRVIALARSAESAARLPAGNVETIRGEVADLDSLRQGLKHADAVIYMAIKGLRGLSPEDSAALNLILDTLAGTDRPFIVTSGVAVYTGLSGAEFDEDTSLEAAAPAVAWRVQLERTVREAAGRGVRSVVIRPSLVYGRGGGSPIMLGLLAYARQNGQAICVGAGENLVPVVHVDDLAAVYALALEHASPGMVFNAAAAGISGKDLARGVSYAAGLDGKIVSLPLAEAVAALGGPAAALAGDLRLSGLRTALVLGWTPAGPSLLYELIHGSLSQPIA